MYLLLLLLWILLNGKFTLEILLFGVVITAAVYWFMCRFLDYSPSADWLLIRNVIPAIHYVVTLFLEIVKSSLAVLKFVTSHSITIEPQIVIFQVPLQSEFLKTILANSITLTPGTITLQVDGNTFYVHALDYTLTEDIQCSPFLLILQQIEHNMEVSRHD